MGVGGSRSGLVWSSAFNGNFSDARHHLLGQRDVQEHRSSVTNVLLWPVTMVTTDQQSPTLRLRTARHR